MKLNKSLVALTTATAVALSGTAVASAQPSQDQGDATGSSAADFFGWTTAEDAAAWNAEHPDAQPMKPTSGVTKFGDVMGMLTAGLGVITFITSLISAVETLIKKFQPAK